MAISMSTFGLGLCYTGQLPFRRVTGETGRKQQRMAVVRAEGGGGGINPEIRKNEEKVVDSVVVTELSKNITPYCREARDLPPSFSSSSAVFSVSGYALCLLRLQSRSVKRLWVLLDKRRWDLLDKRRWVLLCQATVGSSLSKRRGLRREETPWVEQRRRRRGLRKGGDAVG
ncbi:hypothetical protein F2Q70_00004436 [Brassica cretica]|uniref:Uncharacterized protein n=1 Tax=Brassica cretica TaxID=69181 RepID=A0A8S9IRN4_BRACR|nr:hypothetical protein F2Q70_00004436 [Brassica cretica]